MFSNQNNEGEKAKARVKVDRCNKCDKEGHLPAACPTPDAKRTCNLCNKKGHVSKNCPTPDILRTCENCGRRGHVRKNCTTIVIDFPRYQKCTNCDKEGHSARECTYKRPQRDPRPERRDSSGDRPLRQSGDAAEASESKPIPQATPKKAGPESPPVKLMKAVVVSQPGGPEVLEVKEIPRPAPKEGHILIQVKAFGLNRSEMFTRQGHSPDVVFPRVLGIECVGVIENTGSSKSFAKGQKVAAVMGNMGRLYDGGYAQYTLVPKAQVITFKPAANSLRWDTLAAIPEMYLTAWGCLDSIQAKEEQTILIRGGSSSVGLAIAQLAKARNINVISTSRSTEKFDLIKSSGAEHVVQDTGKIAAEVRQLAPKGVNGVIELVGTSTLIDSLQCVAERGFVSMAGCLSGWSLKDFDPMASIPTNVYFTTYSTHEVTREKSSKTLSDIVDLVVAGKLQPMVHHKKFKIDEIVEAHTLMEEGKAVGKLIVVLE